MRVTTEQLEQELRKLIREQMALESRIRVLQATLNDRRQMDRSRKEREQRHQRRKPKVLP